MSRYIKLNIGGKERGLKFGIGFLQQFTEQENMTLTDLFVKFETDSFFTVPKMIYHSLTCNDKIAGNTIDYTINDVYDWVDDLGMKSDEITLYCTTFIESIKVHMPTPEKKEGEEDPEQEGKKKSQKKGTKN